MRSPCTHGLIAAWDDGCHKTQGLMLLNGKGVGAEAIGDSVSGQRLKVVCTHLSGAAVAAWPPSGAWSDPGPAPEGSTSR